MENFISNKILIEILYRNNISHLVLSSGTRNIPFVNAVETDEKFTCYSVIDERSAAFFAMGISQKLQKPVVIACTSGTAASNYLTGVTEAYYSHIPLVVITFDRSPYVLEQLETQKIDQPAIFQSVCKKSVILPVIKDEDDIWYCQRLINEAMIALNQHNPGPVHINVPLIGDTNAMISGAVHQKAISNIKTIDYVPLFAQEKWKIKAELLLKSKKILVVMGQQLPVDRNAKNIITEFTELLHCPILADNLSNFRCNNMIFAEAVIKALNGDTVTGFMPDIVISFGNNFQERIKDLLKAHKGDFEHWSIEPEGIVRDVFKSQTVLFEATPIQFFENMNTYLKECDASCDSEYLTQWKELEKAVRLPEMPFTNFYAIREFAKRIPNNSILHLAILNSTRLTQFFQMDESIEVYSNVNCFGIDGCLPTFMGQAYVTNRLSFLVIGDLSFFYGMNALAIKHRKNNIRILILNNKGAAEFHIQPVSNAIPTIDLHIGAAHNYTAKGWVESIDYEYLTADSKESLKPALSSFVSEKHERPVVLEVFTDMKSDGEFTLHVYQELEKCIKPVVERN